MIIDPFQAGQKQLNWEIDCILIIFAEIDRPAEISLVIFVNFNSGPLDSTFETIFGSSSCVPAFFKRSVSRY